MTLRIAFMGTPDFAARSLAEIAASGHEIVRVYTQPPRRRGRGQSEQKTPVHQLAEILGIPVETPAGFKDPQVIEQFQALDVDAAAVVAYGQILPQSALDAPQYGCLNLHASLLPRWRGAAPIQRAIMAGDATTGVQIQQMEAGLDTGPILLSELVPIKPDDTAASLHDRLMEAGALMWPRTLSALERGSLEAVPQTDDGVTYAHKISSEEARIDWSRSAAELANHIRGLSPFPGAWFQLPGDKGPVRVKVLMAMAVEGAGEPGAALDDTLTIACGEGAVRLVKLQREGKGAMMAEDFLRGTTVPAGTVLG
ncbi:MAG: methionyl-tRNA formyltransferase [Maricaulis sp.]|jgi:methionyl-tRNA formyltransferase|uniref:methionyl-tRNA formyltransferase n=1 Tax=Maricaulis sp. TaxID=1486257 RepID=UPI001B21ADD5|nr:methionyl-tRNA formyltransferase [Maricaulis sp.]MBO6730903.1 methionyl-tRNA formyltransferase [Maricaulis sp.]MBO6846864.1 methionyl-tRNA formyltransferase [Maricaulis sp.]MBO6877620.1 methionyl-tRNA formyltransferase [Maricaulis sp.]MDM7984566.1 methionyl-tRNA formyltransferase [Maricaulis sp.]